MVELDMGGVDLVSLTCERNKWKRFFSFKVLRK